MLFTLVNLLPFLVATVVLNLTPGNDVMFVATQSLSSSFRGGGALAALGVIFYAFYVSCVRSSLPNQHFERHFMKVIVRNLLALLILITVSANAFAEGYPPEVTDCLATYRNQTLCMQDCWCGWCNSSQLCLNGSPESPNNSSSNLGHACSNSSDWIFSSECKSFLHGEHVLLLILALGSGVVVVTYVTCKFLAKQNVYKYGSVPQYNHYGATPYGDL